jgi:hypothetical protein
VAEAVLVMVLLVLVEQVVALMVETKMVLVALEL